VTVQLTFYTSDGRTALQGSGYLPVNSDQNGNLSVGSFQPYVDINSQIDFVQTNYIAGSKWTGKNGKTLDLATTWDGQNSIITIPSGNLENGFLLFVDGNQAITGWNLDTGAALTGKYIYAILGALSSSAVQSFVNPTNIDSLNQSFYASNGSIIGRYPLLDIVTSKGITNVIKFTVPVWGSQPIAPAHVFFTLLYCNGSNNNFNVGQEYEIPFNITVGGFVPNIPANCGLHMRIEFDGLSDWSEVDNYGGGVGVAVKGG